VESPAKLVRERSLRQGLPKDLSLRIDSVPPATAPKCYRAVCILGHRLQDSGQTGVTGTFPTHYHLDGEVLSV
jgi:hypothetical protein